MQLSNGAIPSAKNIHTRIHSQVICAIGLYMIIYICPVCRDTIFSRSLFLQSLFLSLFFGWLVGCQQDIAAGTTHTTYSALLQIDCHKLCGQPIDFGELPGFFFFFLILYSTRIRHPKFPSKESNSLLFFPFEWFIYVLHNIYKMRCCC